MSDAPDSSVRDRVIGGRYRLVRPLGEGGMGVVYLARHVDIDKPVAIKMIAPRLLTRPGVAEKMLNEARIAAKIRHENIVDVTDFGRTESGEVFFAMEYLEGPSLAHEIGRGPMPLSRIRNIIEQIFAALAAAHAVDVIHRDLKPENVLLLQDQRRVDVVKILDFGLAKVRALGEVFESAGGRIEGTPSYMSPEQIRGEPPSLSVDIYAVGCVLYEMLTGRPPFEGASPEEVLRKHLMEPPPSVGGRLPRGRLQEAMDALVLRALAKDRAKRFQTIRELEGAFAAMIALAPAAWRVRALEALETRKLSVHEASTTDASRSFPSRPELARPRPRGRILAAAVAVALLVGAAIALRWPAVREERALRRERLAIAERIERGALIAPADDSALARWRSAAARFPGRGELAASKAALAAALRARADTLLDERHHVEAAALYRGLGSVGIVDREVAARLARAEKGAFAERAGMVPVDDFWIDRYEYPNEKGSVPKTQVDWGAAVELCARAGKRLCSEAEWERACAGTHGLHYPYGTLYDPKICVTSPVEQRPRRAGAAAACLSSFGVADLSGNVAEWTSSPLSAGAPQRVVRGGSFAAGEDRATCLYRDYFIPGVGGARTIGFRCCL